jgi:small subunit ribosomal protein S11
VAWCSGGSCGFAKVNRSSYEAGYQCAVRMFARILQEKRTNGILSLEVIFKGFGQGRDAVQKALVATEGDEIRPLVLRVTDKTPLKIGGTRSKKTRRL